jgi:[ribosomal protein S5]-alanine N-acetyltransferase
MAAILPDRFETRRLILREPRLTDARAIFDAYARDIEVARYTVWRPHVDLSETQTFVSGCVASWLASAAYPYVLTLKASDTEPIGMLEARPDVRTVDVGYVLARRYWGQGFMPEAVSALAEHCLSLSAVFRVQATCDVENRASARTLEKAGFIREGRLERYTLHPNISHEPRPCFIYARCR